MHVRRLILMLTVAALMAALLVVNAVPASAQNFGPGCFFGDTRGGPDFCEVEEDNSSSAKDADPEISEDDRFFENVFENPLFGVSPDLRDFLIDFFD